MRLLLGMKLLVPALTVASLAACGGGDMSDGTTMAPSMPAAAEKTSFTSFTERLISTQSETQEPVPVGDIDFYFPDDDNEAAFAAVVPAV